MTKEELDKLGLLRMTSDELAEELHAMNKVNQERLLISKRSLRISLFSMLCCILALTASVTTLILRLKCQ